ncbi:MAG: M48 family metalloprotease [Candidatus Aenigmarchaeota archaeon]|nr:M48 family metalloprotease [Candidatus Aenigmarchaeota archaeon]
MKFKLYTTMFLTLVLLFGILFAVLAFIGYYFSLPPYLVVLMAIILSLFQWWISPYIIKWTTNLRYISEGEYPWLHSMVKELCRKTKTPVPKIAILNSGAPNAFVFGRTPNDSTLVLSNGLLKSLKKEEIKAVIAHELGHINHKDMIVMTVVSVIPTILYFVARFLIFVPSEGRRKNPTSAVIAGALAYLVYFITNLLVLALSRMREYYADYFSGKHTDPKLLANALAKITYGLSLTKEDKNEHLRAFYIADPVTAAKEAYKLSSEYSNRRIDNEELKKAMEWERKNPIIRISEFFSTHPLTYKRIKALLTMKK